MGLLSDVLLFPITGPVRGLMFVLEQVRDQVDAALQEEAHLRHDLVLLHLQYELGELSQEEFAAQEAALLERLDAIQAQRHDGDSDQDADQDVTDADEADGQATSGGT